MPWTRRQPSGPPSCLQEGLYLLAAPAPPTASGGGGGTATVPQPSTCCCRRPHSSDPGQGARQARVRIGGQAATTRGEAARCCSAWHAVSPTFQAAMWAGSTLFCCPCPAASQGCNRHAADSDRARTQLGCSPSCKAMLAGGGRRAAWAAAGDHLRWLHRACCSRWHPVTRSAEGVPCLLAGGQTRPPQQQGVGRRAQRACRSRRLAQRQPSGLERPQSHQASPAPRLQLHHRGGDEGLPRCPQP